MSSVANKMVQAASGNTGDSPFDNLIQVGPQQGRTLDISDIDNISIEDTFAESITNSLYNPSCSAIDREKGLLFVISSVVGVYLTVWDISDPTDVTILSTNSQYNGGFSNCSQITINTTTQRIYTAGTRRLQSWEYSDAGVMTHKTTFFFSTYQTAGGIAIDTEDDRLYVVTRDSRDSTRQARHYEFDISTPDTFTQIGNSSVNTFDNTDPMPNGASTGSEPPAQTRSFLDTETKILYGSMDRNWYVTAIDVSTNGASSNQNMTLRDTLTDTLYDHRAAAMDFDEKLYFTAGFSSSTTSGGFISCVDVSDPDNLSTTDMVSVLAARSSSFVRYVLKIDPARKLLFQTSRFNSHTIDGATKYRINIIDYSDPTDLTVTTFDTTSGSNNGAKAGWVLELF